MDGAIEQGVTRAGTASPPHLPRARSRLRVAGGVLLTIGLLAAAFWTVAPQQLGGRTAFVVVDGTSMLPRFQRSDLVALRARSSYRVGDVVGYRSAMLRHVVLHRIVRLEAGRYVLKGDNNAFLDPERPTHSQLVGKLWFSIPSAGGAIGVLHRPLVLAALAGILVLVIGLDGGPRRRPDSGPGR